MLPIQTVIAWLAGLLLLVSLALAPFGWGLSIKDHVQYPVKLLQAFVVVFWTILPPIWFWYEYFLVYPNLPKPPVGPTFEEFKYGQDVSSKLWIAATSALLILYFWKDIGH